MRTIIFNNKTYQLENDLDQASIDTLVKLLQHFSEFLSKYDEDNNDSYLIEDIDPRDLNTFCDTVLFDSQYNPPAALIRREFNIIACNWNNMTLGKHCEHFVKALKKPLPDLIADVEKKEEETIQYLATELTKVTSNTAGLNLLQIAPYLNREILKRIAFPFQICLNINHEEKKKNNTINPVIPAIILSNLLNDESSQNLMCNKYFSLNNVYTEEIMSQIVNDPGKLKVFLNELKQKDRLYFINHPKIFGYLLNSNLYLSLPVVINAIDNAEEQQNVINELNKRKATISFKNTNDRVAFFNTYPAHLHKLIAQVFNVFPAGVFKDQNFFKDVDAKHIPQTIASVIPFVEEAQQSTFYALAFSKAFEGSRDAREITNTFWTQINRLDLTAVQLRAFNKGANPICASSLLDELKLLKNNQLAWTYLASSSNALEKFSTLVNNNQHYEVLEYLKSIPAEDQDRVIVLKKAMDAYSTRTRSRFSFSCFNKLQNDKRKLARGVAHSGLEFNELLSHVEQAHSRLSSKANRYWLFSNRWKIRVGGKEKWDENTASKLGKTLSLFKKK